MLTACGGTPGPRAYGRSEVGVFVSSGRTFRTNLYWIEGPTGLVLIDTGFLPADALAAVERAQAATGKQVELAIVLHANPDKFNGTAALQAAGIRVVTTDAVAALIPQVHRLRHRAFAARYPGEYPDAPPVLEAVGDGVQTVTAGGTTVTIRSVGPGCSDAHAVVEWQGHVFVGDLVAHRYHAWLELGHLEAWQARLQEIAARGPVHVHPGRGRSGGPELLAAQASYLTAVADRVRAAAPALPMTSEARAELRAQIEADHPGYGFPVFLDIGLPAVARTVSAAAP